MVFLVTVSLRWLMMMMMAVATYRSPTAIHYPLFNVFSFFFQFDFLFRICVALARANTHRPACMHSVRPMALRFFSIGIFIVLFLLCQCLLFIYDFCGSANRINGQSAVQPARAHTHTLHIAHVFIGYFFLHSLLRIANDFSLFSYIIFRWMRSVPCCTTVRQIKHICRPSNLTDADVMNEIRFLII